MEKQGAASMWQNSFNHETVTMVLKHRNRNTEYITMGEKIYHGLKTQESQHRVYNYGRKNLNVNYNKY